MIGLIQVDGKLPNLALMKISSYYKSLGEHVEFVVDGRQYEKVFAAVLFTWNRRQAEERCYWFDNLERGHVSSRKTA